LKEKPESMGNILNSEDIRKVNEASKRVDLGNMVEGDNSNVNLGSRRLKKYLIISGFIILGILASYRLAGGEDNCIRIADHQPSIEYINDQPVPLNNNIYQ